MNILLKARWLSLDITIGAIVLLFFISRIHEIEPSVHVYIALAIAIWSIYTLDHLRDARGPSGYRSGRHQYHRDNFERIVLVQIVALAAGVINMFFLPRSIIQAGLIVAGLSGIYLIMQSSLAKVGLKEVVIAVGYATGIFLYPIQVLQGGEGILMEYVQLTGLALTNILIIAFYDFQEDKHAGFGSFVSFAGYERTRSIIILLITIQSMVGVYLLSRSDRLMYQLFILMSLVIFSLVLWKRSFFIHSDRYRLWSDLVFFLPLAIILVEELL